MVLSKTFLLLGLAFAVFLLISSEVSARELAETTQTQSAETNMEKTNYDTFLRHRHSHGHGHHHGHHHHHHGHHHHHHHGHRHGHGHGADEVEMEDGEN